MHLGLQDNEGGLDTRAITLKEVAFLGAYTYTSADLRATVDLLDSQALGRFYGLKSCSFSYRVPTLLLTLLVVIHLRRR